MKKTILISVIFISILLFSSIAVFAEDAIDMSGSRPTITITNPATESARTGIVPCGGTSDPCTLCHLIIGIWNLIEWGKNILVTVAIVAIFISGIMYTISTGNEKLITQAKAFLTASLVGFAITLAAWLIVDVAITWVANAKPDLDIEKTSWHTFTCDTTSSALSGSGTTTGGAITTSAGAGGNCGGLSTQSGIDKQCGDASSELNTLLNCIQGELGSKVTVSSVSDGNGGLTCYEDHPTWSQCRANVQSSCCYHSKGSLHYASGGSKAADFVGNGASNSEISSAIQTCRGSALNEGNHVHGSIK